jgi:glutamate/tyrosine decarboxylase-like PLP-dependent enzyme
MVCFQHVPAARKMSERKLSTYNQTIRQRLAAGTNAYVTGVELGGRYWLRAQIMSPNTTPESNSKLMELIRQAGVRHGIEVPNTPHAEVSARA